MVVEKMNRRIEAMAVGETIVFGYCGICWQPYPWDELKGTSAPYGQGVCEECRKKKSPFLTFPYRRS